MKKAQSLLDYWRACVADLHRAGHGQDERATVAHDQPAKDLSVDSGVPNEARR